MTHKTKATLQGRPSNTNKSTIDITRPCAGGQSLTDALNSASTNLPNIVGLVEPTILKLLATFRGLVEPTILKRVANLQLGLGCAENFGHLIVGYAPLQHTFITTLILGGWGYAGFWRHPDKRYRGCTPLPYTPDDSRNFSRCSYVSNVLKIEAADLIQVFGSSLACLRSRRLISPCMAATINWAVLSPCSFTFSIASITSCGARACSFCDLSFFVPVAITESPKNWWSTVYLGKNKIKHLKWIPLYIYSGLHLELFRAQEIAKPAGATNTNGPLTKPLIGVTVMAESQHTQTHPKFTWRFLALSALGRNVIHITATTEREARELSPAGCVMVFAGRLPVQEMRHA